MQAPLLSPEFTEHWQKNFFNVWLLASTATRSWTYGDSGATATDSGIAGTLDYDSSDRLVAAGGKDYAHNAMGQRVRKADAAVATRFHYGLSGRVLAEYRDDLSGFPDQDWEYEYIWLDGMLLHRYKTNYLGGTFLGRARNAVHTDHLGKVTKVTLADASLSASFKYKPFGALTNPAGNYNFRFPGQYADAETGLHYNYFRDYDPSTGRYIQSDPIGLGGGLNTYGYVGGNPVMRRDPDGLDKEVLISELWERWEYYESPNDVGVIDVDPIDVKSKSQKVWGTVLDQCEVINEYPIDSDWNVYDEYNLSATPPYRYDRRGTHYEYGYMVPGWRINFRPKCAQGVLPDDNPDYYRRVLCRPSKYRIENDGWE